MNTLEIVITIVGIALAIEGANKWNLEWREDEGLLDGMRFRRLRYWLARRRAP